MCIWDETNFDTNGSPYSLHDNGIGIIDYMPVPHFDTPEHPESHLMYDVVKYLQDHNLSYQTLHDGDVIIEPDKNKTLK